MLRAFWLEFFNSTSQTKFKKIEKMSGKEDKARSQILFKRYLERRGRKNNVLNINNYS